MPDFSHTTIIQAIAHKNILITGGSSGIGKQTALLLAEYGAHVILVSRSIDKLTQVKKEIRNAGGQCSIYAHDLTDIAHTPQLIKQILAEHKHIDILINNAGRSIRRSVEESFNRFHDYERTMQINYFASIKLILKLLPSMIERKQGHIINISSIGVLANSPRFGAYIASKAALDAFSRSLAAEVKSNKVQVTNVFMPLVKTPMIAPTKLYKLAPTLTPHDAAMLILQAIIEKPYELATPLGKFASISYAVAPKTTVAMHAKTFQLLSKVSKPKGEIEVYHEDGVNKSGVLKKLFAKRKKK